MYYHHTKNNVFHDREVIFENETGYILEAEIVREKTKATCYVTDQKNNPNQIFLYTKHDLIQSIITKLSIEIQYEKHREDALVWMRAEKHTRDEKKRKAIEKELRTKGKYVPNKVSLEHMKDHQQWCFKNGYIVSKLHGLVLDIAGTPQRGSQVIVTAAAGKPTQKWRIRFAGKDAELNEMYDRMCKEVAEQIEQNKRMNPTDFNPPLVVLNGDTLPPFEPERIEQVNDPNQSTGQTVPELPEFNPF